MLDFYPSKGLKGNISNINNGLEIHHYGHIDWTDFTFYFENDYLIKVIIRIDWRAPKMFIDQLNQLVKKYNLIVKSSNFNTRETFKFSIKTLLQKVKEYEEQCSLGVNYQQKILKILKI